MCGGRGMFHVEHISRPFYYTLNMTKIVLYKTVSPPNKVQKELTDDYELNCTLFEGCNILSPSLYLELDTHPNYNYAYIPDFSRYYYVTNVICDTYGRYTLSLAIDVLYTYSAYILALKGHITARTDGNMFASNRGGVYDLRPQFDTVKFTTPENGFNDEGTIIMITIKGKISD